MTPTACTGHLKWIVLAAAVVLSGCASGGPSADRRVEEYQAEINRLNAQLAAESAERQRITRAAARREESLRRQLEAMKSIERSILEREDRTQNEAR